MSRKLLIIGCSKKKASNTEPIRAIYRYKGQYWQTLKKALIKCNRPPLMFAFSSKMGFISVKDKILWYDEMSWDMGKIEAFKLQFFNNVLPQIKPSSEVFIAAGAPYRNAMFQMGIFSALKDQNVHIITPIRGTGTTQAMLRDWIIGDSNGT
jgi:hypothetical protein